MSSGEALPSGVALLGGGTPWRLTLMNLRRGSSFGDRALWRWHSAEVDTDEGKIGIELEDLRVK